MTLNTDWAFNVNVDAQDLDDAYAKATEYLADALLALDALTKGQPYRAYLTSVTSPSGVTQTALSIVGEFAYNTADLDESNARIVEGWMETLRSHPKARAAARSVNNGIALWDSSFGSMPMAVAALLSFFQAVEIVIQNFAPTGRDEAEDRGAWNATWAPVLSTATGDKLSSAVREAALGLQRIETATFESRIRAAGAAFGLDSETIENACRFSRLRSRQLAHATTKSLSHSTRDEWLGGDTPLAFIVSLAFVSGYVTLLRSA